MAFFLTLMLAAIAGMHTGGAERPCNHSAPFWKHECGCESFCQEDDTCGPPAPVPAPIPPPKVPTKDLPEEGEACGFLWDTHISPGSVCGKTEPDYFGKVKLDTCIKANETNFPLEAFHYPWISPTFKSFMVTCGTCWSVPYVLHENDDCTGKEQHDAARQQCGVRTGHSFAAILCKSADHMMV